MNEAISVEVSVHCDAWLDACPEAAALAAAAARAALSQAAGRLGGAPLTLGLILTDDAEQRGLNHTYRGQDAATNVLAFALADPPPPAGEPVLLGDVGVAFASAHAVAPPAPAARAAQLARNDGCADRGGRARGRHPDHPAGAVPDR